MNQEETIGPVNIGNPGEFTIKQLAELASRRSSRKSKIIYLPLPGDDPKQRKPDITKARKYLEWEPKVPLEQGIVKAAEYFRELDLAASRSRPSTRRTSTRKRSRATRSAKRPREEGRRVRPPPPPPPPVEREATSGSARCLALGSFPWRRLDRTSEMH